MEPDPSPIEMFVLIGPGAVIRAAPPARRARILRDITTGVGDPSVIPIHDGNALPMATALRALYDRFVPTWA